MGRKGGKYSRRFGRKNRSRGEVGRWTSTTDTYTAQHDNNLIATLSPYVGGQQWLDWVCLRDPSRIDDYQNLAIASFLTSRRGSVTQPFIGNYSGMYTSVDPHAIDPNHLWIQVRREVSRYTVVNTCNYPVHVLVEYYEVRRTLGGRGAANKLEWPVYSVDSYTTATYLPDGANYCKYATTIGNLRSLGAIERRFPIERNTALSVLFKTPWTGGWAGTYWVDPSSGTTVPDRVITDSPATAVNLEKRQVAFTVARTWYSTEKPYDLTAAYDWATFPTYTSKRNWMLKRYVKVKRIKKFIVPVGGKASFQFKSRPYSWNPLRDGTQFNSTLDNFGGGTLNTTKNPQYSFVISGTYPMFRPTYYGKEPFGIPPSTIVSFAVKGPLCHDTASTDTANLTYQNVSCDIMHTHYAQFRAVQRRPPPASVVEHNLSNTATAANVKSFFATSAPAAAAASLND